jgi:hypothetical protein
VRQWIEDYRRQHGLEGHRAAVLLGALLEQRPDPKLRGGEAVFRAHRVRIILLPPRLTHILGALAAEGVGRSCLAVRASEDTAAIWVHSQLAE